jgi:hypothetical protein
VFEVQVEVHSSQAGTSRPLGTSKQKKSAGQSGMFVPVTFSEECATVDPVSVLEVHSETVPHSSQKVTGTNTPNMPVLEVHLETVVPHSSQKVTETSMPVLEVHSETVPHSSQKVTETNMLNMPVLEVHSETVPRSSQKVTGTNMPNMPVLEVHSSQEAAGTSWPLLVTSKNKKSGKAKQTKTQTGEKGTHTGVTQTLRHTEPNTPVLDMDNGEGNSSRVESPRESSGEEPDESSEEELGESSDESSDESLRESSIDDGSNNVPNANANNYLNEAGEPRRQQRRGTRFKVPWSDNDPDADPGINDHNHVEFCQDKNAWTRNNSAVKKMKFRGKKHGATFPTPTGSSALYFFLEFWPVMIFTYIARWTNIVIRAVNQRHADERIMHNGHLRKVTRTTGAEVRAWMGIRIAMGAVVVQNMRQYWSLRPGYNNRLIANTMSRNRFEELCEHLQFCNPNNNPDNWPKETREEKKKFFKETTKNPLYLIRQIWDMVNEMCRVKYNLARELALDEAMIAYKGMKAKLRRIYMPLKPTRVGFKIYALAESATGYIANFNYQVIKEKMIDVVLKLVGPFTDQYHHIFTDKAYTGVETAAQLMAQKTYMTGAIKTDAKGLPEDLLFRSNVNPESKRMTELNRCPRGTFYVRQKGKMTYAVMKDSKILPLLSTAHSGYRNKTTDTINRRFSKDGIAKAATHTIPAPPQAISYQKYYGGVDKADQLRSYFSCARKSNRWVFQVLFFLLDVARVNAYICYKAANGIVPGSKTSSHAKFVMDLAEQLIDGYNPGRGPKQMQNTRTNKQPTKHKLVRMKSKFSKACVGCLAKRRKRTDKGKRAHRSVNGCSACNQHMCKLCFFELHPDPNRPTRISDHSDGQGNVQCHPANDTADDADVTADDADVTADDADVTTADDADVSDAVQSDPYVLDAVQSDPVYSADNAE